MRLLPILMFVFFCTTGMAQVTEDRKLKDSVNPEGLPYFKLREPAGYILDKQEFTFTPELEAIHVSKVEDEDEVDFGDLRRTTPDGLYMMVSTLNEDVSFGRFDSIGNFRAFRYDRERDTVVEEIYRRKSKLDTIPDPE